MDYGLITCQLCGASDKRRLITLCRGASFYEPLEGWTFTLVGGWRCPKCPLTLEETQEEDKFRLK